MQIKPDGTKIVHYKNYVISQNAVNHHVMISENNHMVFHSQCEKPYDENGLIDIADKYEKLKALAEERND